MKAVSLNGKWIVRKKSGGAGLPARVPGSVHRDLLEQGVIDDPYYRDNEKALQWIGEENWVYSRKFHVRSVIPGAGYLG